LSWRDIVGALNYATHTYTRTQEVPTKGKAIPLQALTGPEVSSRLRIPDFKTIGT
jgi:hypothetical protein